MSSAADVAGRMEAVLLRALEADGHDVTHMVTKLPVSRAELDDRNTWISWDEHLALLAETELLCGGREGLIELGRNMNRPEVLGQMSRMFGVLTLRRMYELMIRFSGPSGFRPAKASFSAVADGSYRIEVTIDPDYEGSLRFFHVLQGSLEGVPRMSGLPLSIVNAEMTPHHATFRVVPPPTRSVVGWPGRVWRSLSGSGSAIDEMVNQHNELRQSLIDLDESNRRLATQEERYRRLAENSSDIIAEWDDTGRCLYVSPSVAKLLGYSPEEFIERGNDLVHPDDRGVAADALALRVGSAGSGHALFRLKHGDGSWRWFEGASSAFVTANGERRAVTGARDVTERIRLEEQLQQSQKMEAIGRLAGGVAHDFNNLLTVIVGSTELLTDGLGGVAQSDATSGLTPKDVDRLVQAAENVRGAADRAAGLTRSLLAFSRQQSAQHQVLDFNEIVRRMGEILRRLVGEDVQLTVHVGAEPCVVEADPIHLEQVLFNLAANARDAMAEGGNLDIELDVAELDADSVRELGIDHEMEPGSYVRLRVADEGRGMNAETRTHVFEPFFTTKGDGDSVGLGLSTVYGIVQMSGGAVTLTSEPFSGTTVEVYLPRSTTPLEATDEITDENVVQVDGEKILLVEDEPNVRQIVQGMLEAVGYDVSTAESGEDALDTADHRIGEFDLLITDVVMPGISGLELAGSLRERRDDLKVLFMSGYAAGSMSTTVDADPLFERIAKPFDSSDLTAKVKEMLRS